MFTSRLEKLKSKSVPTIIGLKNIFIINPVHIVYTAFSTPV